MTRGRARIRLCLEEYTEPVYRALLAETRQKAPQKGRVYISIVDGCLVIDVDSGDLSGLRAITSSFLYLAHAAYSSLARSRK